MTLFKITAAMLLSLSSLAVFANSYEDQFKPLIASQPTAEKFIQNYEKINQEVQKKADLWNDKPSESPEIWFPICVGYESRIAILENNKKYKKQFDAQVRDGYPTFDEALEEHKNERLYADELCQKAKQNIK